MDVLDVFISALLSLGLTYTVVACDRLGLTPAQRARGWNAASTGSAIIAFAPLCIVAHFWVTRRSLRGILLGLLWTALTVAVQVALFSLHQSLGVAWLLAAVVLAPLLATLLLPLAAALWLL